MGDASESNQRVAAPDPHKPHSFEEVQLLSGSMPFPPRGVAGPYVAPPIPGGESRLCGLCGKARSDHLHIEGEAEADAESPRWGM
jgi:hypothetical protein